jgi:hypothetical protein
MTLARRVAAIETSLSPTQLVLRWLADAHSYSVERYVASLVACDPPANPLDRLAREAVHGAQVAMRGKRPEVVAEAVRSALRETVFRFELVVRINVMSLELLDREALISGALSAHVALLTSEKPPAKYTERLARLRELLAFRVSELRATQEARSIVESRYLDGHAALFPDAAAASGAQLVGTEAIVDLALRLTGVADVPPDLPPDQEALPRRPLELVAALVEPAKVEALDKLGDGERAFGIAAEWVRTRVASTATPMSQAANLQP